MFSVYKGQKVNEDEKRVIDSNDRVFELIEAYNEKLKEVKQKRREDALMDLLDILEPDEEGNYYLPRDEDGNFDIPLDEDGVPLVDVDEYGMLIPASEESEEVVPEEGEEIDPEAEEEEQIDPHEQAEFILGNARLEAEEIIAEAQSQADAYRQNAKEEGRQEGYTMGQAQAMAELDTKVAELEQERAGIQEEANRLQADYEARLASMEVELVDMISDIIQKVFLAEFSDKREITLHLIENALSGVENSREFLIRVNEANYDFLVEHKDELQEKVGEGAVLDFIRDPLMEDAKCLIETDGGVFDCGMDTQMRNLINDIKALSLMN